MSEKKIETKTIKTAEPIEDQTSFPEIKQYPVVPAPAPQVPPAEVGEAVAAPSGHTNLIAMGDSIKSGDYIKLDEPVDSPFVGFNGNSGFGLQGLISNADKVSLDKFLDFKTEVIKAFRHLGLDTRRHFTE